MSEFWLFYLALAALLGAGSYAIAQRKGYNPAMAGAITALAAVISFFAAGLICLFVYAVLRPKHHYCPDCGEPNIHYLKCCRRCNRTLP